MTDGSITERHAGTDEREACSFLWLSSTDRYITCVMSPAAVKGARYLLIPPYVCQQAAGPEEEPHKLLPLIDHISYHSRPLQTRL